MPAPNINREMNDAFNRELEREREYDHQELDLVVQMNAPLLKPQQKEVYDTLMKAIEDKNGGLYFLDAPGGTGIGRQLVKQLTKCGAKVIAIARNQVLLETLKEEVPSIQIIPLDLSDWHKTEEALKNVEPVDLLVNNAGLAILGPLTEVKEEDIDRLFSINVKALINITKIVTKSLLARNAPGSIVNISSQASLVGLLDHTVYCATKGAVDAFTRAAALEYGPKNIRVNAVNPTVIMTDMGKLGWSDPAVATPMLAKIPLRRFGEVHEVVNAVMYLLSDKASMITGTCLPIDGGYVAS